MSKKKSLETVPTKAKKRRHRRFKLPPYSSYLTNNEDIYTEPWPCECINDNNSTVIGKMVDIYLEQPEEILRDEHFVKCDYLQLLYEKEKMNCVILKHYPSRRHFFMASPDKEEPIYKLNAFENEEVFECIEKEEISTTLLALLEKRNLKLLYDYHVVLQVQKFANDTSSDPLKCRFLLLKPTDRVRSYYIFKKYLPGEKTGLVPLMKRKEKEKERMLPLKYESKVLKKICPPLYFGNHEATLSIYVQDIYKKNFNFMDRKLLSKQHSETLHNFLKANEKIWDPIEPEMFCKKEIKGPFFIDLLDELKFILTSRNIDNKNLEINVLVEIFYFEISKSSNPKKELHSTTEVHISMRNGIFFTCETGFYGVTNTNSYPVGNRTDLDNYLLAFTEALSKKFCFKLCIKHKNCLDSNAPVTTIFTCGSDSEDELGNTESDMGASSMGAAKSTEVENVPLRVPFQERNKNPPLEPFIITSDTLWSISNLWEQL